MTINLTKSTYVPAALDIEILISEFIDGNEVVAYYLKNGKPSELGRISYTPWDNPPYGEKGVLSNVPQEVVDNTKLILFAKVKEYPPA